MNGNSENIPKTALDWHRDGRKVALATVIKTWGSAPRPVGSQLVVDEAQAFEGSVSGGCVEGAVIFEAGDAMSDGKNRVLSFGVSDDTAFEVGLACGFASGFAPLYKSVFGRTPAETRRLKRQSSGSAHLRG